MQYWIYAYEFAVLISYHIEEEDACRYFTFSQISALLLIFVLESCRDRLTMYFMYMFSKQEEIAGEEY